jgi:hypothetical protein
LIQVNKSGPALEKIPRQQQGEWHRPVTEYWQSG